MTFNRNIKHSCLALLLFMLSANFSICNAQTIDFSAPVSFHYDGKTISAVLDDLANTHGIAFSYSRQIVPIHQRLYCHVDNMPFGEAIELLFAQTQVIYGVIGDQIVLSIDINKSPIPPDMGFFDDGFDDSLASSKHVVFVERPQFDIMPLELRDATIQYTPSRINPEVVEYDLHYRVRRAQFRQPDVRAQVTVIPPIQADSDPHGTEPLNLSFNLFAGVNESVQGLEFGGLANVLTEDMKGVQAAGLVNVVGHNFQGVQAAGLVNSVKDNATGLQAAGLVNTAGSGLVMQAAGLANYARGTVSGQAAGLINVANTVNGAQVSGLINVARTVKGAQIGLFNVADSVGGVPIGLMSFVRKRGYHSIEFGGEDAIDFNLNLRLGVRAFYNILHVGLDEEGENWSLGYGFGTSIFLAKKNYLQFEVMSRQISEGEPWTSELNLLNQLKMTYDFALGRNVRIALGPSFNVATSRRFDSETGTYGTQVPRYVMFEHTYDDNFHSPLNVKYWVGFHAGLRFGSADVSRDRPNRAFD